MKPVMVNGIGPMPPRVAPSEAAAGGVQARSQKGFEPLPVPRVSSETLRKLDHPEWLEGFARSLQLRTTVEMTPYRVGVLNRVLLCAEYIRLLRHDITRLEKRVAAFEAAESGGEPRSEVI